MCGINASTLLKKESIYFYLGMLGNKNKKNKLLTSSQQNKIKKFLM